MFFINEVILNNIIHNITRVITNIQNIKTEQDKKKVVLQLEHIRESLLCSCDCEEKENNNGKENKKEKSRE